ncbi:hypothetical protein GTR02_15605 [Kineococcus sp. R8]|uniref:hypothetical protein n=1 Tax=Kineococcus siccus TaxID=2696567 RepID=UPI001411B8BF|nr:hypothetical protein [Kineococcus siccus]NAZ83245.1 hypothetical protein [Kineococcus siccus]
MFFVDPQRYSDWGLMSDEDFDELQAGEFSFVGVTYAVNWLPSPRGVELLRELGAIGDPP